MNGNGTILGIDAGSISLGAVETDLRGNIVRTYYVFHRGMVIEALDDLLAEYKDGSLRAIAVTSSTPDCIRGALRIDSRVACITAARRIHGNSGSLLIVGGEKFGLVSFDDDGNYLNYRSNSSCAAGTGSFLDQQARRLNLDISAFSDRAYNNSGALPKIASRCAVFAKTDLIHAQQTGHTVDEICDGLCMGLARNIRDTLFTGGEARLPLVFAGGVSKNRAVVRHLSSLMGTEIVVNEHSHLFGALGAALIRLEEGEGEGRIVDPVGLIRRERKERLYHYPALELAGSDYPDFSGMENYEYQPRTGRLDLPVEVDIYEKLLPGTVEVFLGIDIGSTSTKAVLVDADRRVLAGFYTRTSGRPVEAVQNIFETMEDVAAAKELRLAFLGAGTTGSGRKIIARIINADLALDEITAHARAAFELDPTTDTIIEIGGQDAKFTTMSGGMVTFSIMNNVCAAGTGSFIEEQAKKLACPLSEYSARALGERAPLSSDRCTVFMERDLNYYLGERYSVPEILASVLHSVRDNYLMKVAGQGNIGRRIFFQGATAKNRALVAAFEQKLGRPIMVSKFCHLTGALGAALCLCDEGGGQSLFRGLEVLRHSIPVRSETCGLCTNHCKLSVAEVAGETVAFGFLCGRDYDTPKFVKNETPVPELLLKRKEAVPLRNRTAEQSSFTVGIPAALHLFDQMTFWKAFFSELSIMTVSGEPFRDSVRKGKERSGAEFCAPMTALQGQVDYLLEKADFIFLPVYLEVKRDDPSIRRHYCYYTQYGPAVVACAESVADRERIIMPVTRSLQGRFPMKVELFRALKKIPGFDANFFRVSQAYDRAAEIQSEEEEGLRRLFREEAGKGGEMEVVLLGRPYTVLSRAMNNSIPDIFARLGVRAWFQDMLDYDGADTTAITPLLEAFHWNYAAKILEAAEIVAGSRGLYPVLVTSFKCTPDSYVIDYFKAILESRKKPYLILQLDDHDSSVGYETRIEAGIRSFRNHFRRKENLLPGYRVSPNPDVTRDKGILEGRTLLLPNWDGITGRLLAANLRGAGIEARLMTETDDSIRRGLRFNTGQCIPLAAVAQCVIDYIEHNGLVPAQTALWLFESNISCNVRMFPYYTKRILESQGLRDVAIYRGDITFLDMSVATAVDAYFAYMFGGLLRKAGCVIRPYETERGNTDRVIMESTAILARAFETKTPKETALRTVVDMLKGIPRSGGGRPKVAIFGDLYVRDNDVMNQNLVRVIEENGGEVITTPYSDYMKIIADPYIRKWFDEGLYARTAAAKIISLTVPLLEKKYQEMFSEIIQEPVHISPGDYEEALARLNITARHTGESMDNVLKIFSLVQTHPDISLFVQTNPSYCCPALVTEAMAGEIERITGIPVLTIEYDGTGGPGNDDIIPYLKYPRKRKGEAMKGAI